MNDKKFLQKLREKQNEIREVPFHDFGPLTPFYRETVPLFKIAPWRMGILLAIGMTILMIYLLGPSFIRLASLLSRGF